MEKDAEFFGRVRRIIGFAHQDAVQGIVLQDRRRSQLHQGRHFVRPQFTRQHAGHDSTLGMPQEGNPAREIQSLGISEHRLSVLDFRQDRHLAEPAVAPSVPVEVEPEGSDTLGLQRLGNALQRLQGLVGHETVHEDHQRTFLPLRQRGLLEKGRYPPLGPLEIHFRLH